MKGLGSISNAGSDISLQGLFVAYKESSLTINNALKVIPFVSMENVYLDQKQNEAMTIFMRDLLAGVVREAGLSTLEKYQIKDMSSRSTMILMARVDADDPEIEQAIEDQGGSDAKWGVPHYMLLFYAHPLEGGLIRFLFQTDAIGHGKSELMTAANEEISVEALAGMMNVSRTNLLKKIHEED